ncbi:MULTISPECIES: sugar ABC transporter substrate-binding protein [unclassified Nocardioides]|uniref:sugar ABC transporter substrate-binding protein n=1 Tax=unclassified Nocardioides TaxID=2615069 RepID=UPI0000574A64|nr:MULTISPECIES: sugar ABC transporter substrate-binding protein [unclassified Nocardioides]ABL80139.1 monosaccharide ABC transporter substrate-binding protein, CUT2 family [Nocardioides sp. JS614]
MRSTFNRPARRLAGVSVALAVIAAGAACSTESGEQTIGSGGGDEIAQNAAEALDSNFYGQGSYTEPPAEGPEAQRGARIAVVNSGVQSPTGTKQVEAAREVAGLLGWDLSVYDGKYEPAEYQEGIRQAISQKADVIWLYSIDCPLAETALAEAKRAGIPVVSQEAADCTDVDPEAESYFADTLAFSQGTFIDWARAMGESQATWLLAQLGEDADVIEVSVPELVVTNAIHEGFTAAMEEQCPACKVTEVKAQIADFGPALQEKIETALLRNPNANGMALSYDDLMTTGGSAAVMASGRNDSLAVVAGSGFPANVKLIRDGQGQDAGFAYDMGYETWAAADMINRLLAGEEQGESGVGIAVFDADNGLPPAGKAWSVDIEYKPVYKAMWGVS